MTMSAIEAVSDQDVDPPGGDGENGEAREEDPEHRITAACTTEPPTSDVDLLQTVTSGLLDNWLSSILAGQGDAKTSIVLLDSEEFTRALDDVEFRNDLRRACQWAFSNCRQSTHGSWEDLQQEVLMRFGKWLPRYRAEAKRRTVFERIATNLLIDAKRRETTKRRYHEEIDLDELQHDSVGNNPWIGIEDHIFLKECRNSLSKVERQLLDDYFVEGRSLRQLATMHGISAPGISKKLGRIVKKLKEHQEREKGSRRKVGRTPLHVETLRIAAAA